MNASPKPMSNGPSTPEQLQRDRITAVIVLVVMAALVALLVWLGGDGSVGSPTDYWPMMP